MTFWRTDVSASIVRAPGNVRTLKISKEETLVLIVFFFFATQLFVVLFLNDDAPNQDVKETLRFGWIPAYIAILALVLPRFQVVLAVPRRPPLILLLNLLCFPSVLSPVPPPL